MGRVSRYKKIKSIDPFAKNGSWKSDVGDCNTLRRAKKKSKTALKMKEKKTLMQQRRMRGKKDDGAGRKSGGGNGFGDDDGYDLPPDGEDEFDMKDLMGSVKKQRHKSDLLLDTKSPSQWATVTPSGAREVEKVDKRGVSGASNGKSSDNKVPTSKKQPNNANDSKSKYNSDGTLKITAKTSTREIIEAHSNPRKAQKNANQGAFGASKQEKRKAYLDKKKLKKRNRGNRTLDDDGDDEEYARQQALQSLHSQSHSSSTQQKEVTKTKKHVVKQQNYTHTMVARTVMDEQVERPPTFTTLPRGANKLAKNKKAKHDNDSGNSNLSNEDDQAKAQRIRKEQQALEAMRERVMKQYAVLRESRRSR